MWNRGNYTPALSKVLQIKRDPVYSSVPAFSSVVKLVFFLLVGFLLPGLDLGAATLQSVRVKDLITIEGIRENYLSGLGLVVGLNGTGDKQQTIFTTQTLANTLQRMGVQVNGTTLKVNNVAAVWVTANLPAFARPGIQIDVSVSSVGDAKSIEGGLLLMTQLKAANGQVYAVAQGPLAVGGYSAGGAAIRAR